MSIIDYNSGKRVLVSVKGHPYERDAFFNIFEEMEGIAYTAVEQPASQLFWSSLQSANYDAIVSYDMPGIDFSTQPPHLVSPPDQFKQDFLDLLEAGKGMVFLHHAIAAWPTWSQYAEVLGGKFWYLEGRYRDQPFCDSGYQHNVQHTVRVLADHPVTSGVDPEFAITDELYLYDVWDDSIIPLLSSDAEFDQKHFFSASEAVSGRLCSRNNWQRTTGSNLIGWVKSYLNSPIVYLQMGDGPSAYSNPNFLKLLENAIQWVSGSEALEWARSNK